MPSRKRHNTTEEEEQGDEPVVEEEEETEEAEEMGEEESGNAESEEDEYEAPNEDDGMDEYEEKEDEEAVATPPAAKRRRQENAPRSAPRALNRPGEAAQVGIIQQILVENFMCHRKLRVDLCRNINFIHGQNGSGKSAILAAIQICLGAGARRTNRARNLKAMIRTDHANPPTHAKVSVTLRNEGEDAFRQEDFGKKITVERTIHRAAGYNGYKLFDENMKEVSRARKDLDDMLDHLNIQVENPVAILDQEEAKKFLTGKATDKYAFFLNACELERLDRSYATLLDNLRDCVTAKERLAGGLEMERQRVAELKKKYDQHRELDKLQTKLLTEQCKYAWALWQESEVGLEDAKKRMQSFQEKAAKKREELSQAEQLSQESTGGQEELAAKIEELTAEVQQLANQKKELEEQKKGAMEPFHQQEQRVKQLERKEKQAKKDLVAARKRLQEALNEIASNNKESEMGRLVTALAKAEEDLSVARQQEDGLRQEVADKLKLYEGLEPRVQEARRDHQELENKFQHARSKLEGMERSSGDTLAIFGRNVKKVRSEIDRRKREFKGPVVGPIGAYIKIQAGKEEFAALAETTLGPGTLDRFIVTNNHDRQIVQQIRNKAGCRQDCGIFQMSAGNGRFAVPDPPVAGVETVASVLRIENDLVFNCLVDNCRIDQIALARDLIKSEQTLIETNGNGDQQIKGIVKQVYCLPRGDMWNIKNGQKSVISNERQLNSTIGKDMTAAITEMKREIVKLQSEVQSAGREADRLDGQHTGYKRGWNDGRRAQRKNTDLINKLSDDIDRIKAEMDATEGNQIDTTEQEEDVAQQEENVKKYGDDKLRALEDLELMKPAVEELKQNLRESETQSEKVLKDLGTAEGDMAKFLETQNQRKDVVSRKREKIQQYEKVMQLHSEKLEALQSEFDDFLEKARKMQFRLDQRKASEKKSSDQTAQDGEELVEPTQEILSSIQSQHFEKNAEYYESKVVRIQEKIEKERERQKLNEEDPVEAYQRWNEAKEACSKKLDDLANLEETIKDHGQDLKLRRRLWKKFRSYLGQKTGEKFQELLLMNKYTGDLNFDHDSKQLTLNVRKQNSAASQTSDVKGLSGGERSYTTIALLIALGEYLETPFRVMDEFDVFLDAQVRKFVIQALIHTAKEMQHRQFIFITPQDLSGIEQDPQLKIFKLNPPERYNKVGPSQQTLNLSPHALEDE